MPKTPQSRESVLALLVADHPVIGEARPLAIGIHKAIIAAHPGIDRGALRGVMQRHTAATRYLKAVAAGGPRFGLDGAPAGEITAEQQQQAREDLKERFRRPGEQARALQKEQERQARLQLLVDHFKSR
jgi:ProP effector